MVAPLVGAWIEIDKLDKDINGKHVAPLVGAWIEITLPICMTVMIPSLPLWERGLKSLSPGRPDNRNAVAPLVGAWIEICYAC